MLYPLQLQKKKYLPLRDPVANCFPLEFGINCFASQILSGASVPEKGDRVPLKRRKADPAVKRSKCHAWQKDGKCRFGDECKFAHEDRE
jgi:hypothetical protein